MVGERSGRSYRLGDVLEVIVSRVNLEDRQIDFDLVESLDSNLAALGKGKLKAGAGKAKAGTSKSSSAKKGATGKKAADSASKQQSSKQQPSKRRKSSKRPGKKERARLKGLL